MSTKAPAPIDCRTEVNADWTKRTWDLLSVETFDDLLKHLRVTDKDAAAKKKAVEHFSKLPCYKAAPDAVKEGVEAMLAGDA
jgi:hypothetical protein